MFEIIQLIKDTNAKVGISIKPETKIEEIYEYLPYIHMVLIMTVEPGKGGQTLIKEMKDKISGLHKYILNNDLEVDIEADGGINLGTAESIKAAGTNILVAGTAILSAIDYSKIVEELKK
ncbi:Ribulose-phosphate 3-epimerase [compost metagenome]